MIYVKIEVHEDKIREILAKFPSESAKVIQSEIHSWALRTSNLAKRRAPYRTGNLAQSIIGYRYGTGAGVFATVDYAKYVEPPPLGVPMTRPMTRTQYLYNSAMEEVDRMIDRISQKLLKLIGE